ncbi:helix-turn-helix domain-containing protein [Mucilaginibacter sp. AW1-7]|uniref:helix-turn-helix domain-containing protein n=1 Tax=Mucilaginibacter sp. AW1-7 TaxID=3349874 RepID=UPI003F732263
MIRAKDYFVNDYFNNGSTIGEDSHYGHAVERFERKDHMGISEIARKLNVSRRTLYDWFETKRFSLDITCQIGFVIDHDFSNDFPDAFARRINSLNADNGFERLLGKGQPRDATYYWMDKYITLPEKFNEVLSQAGRN